MQQEDKIENEMFQYKPVKFLAKLEYEYLLITLWMINKMPLCQKYLPLNFNLRTFSLSLTIYFNIKKML